MSSEQPSIIIGVGILVTVLSILVISPIANNQVFAGVRHNDHGKKNDHGHHKWRHHWNFNDCRFNHWKFNH
jgi:hypothetical protein